MSLKNFDLFLEVYKLLKHIKKSTVITSKKKKKLNKNKAILFSLLLGSYNIKTRIKLKNESFISNLSVYNFTKINFYNVPIKLHKNKKVGILFITSNYKFTYFTSYLNVKFKPVVTLSTGYVLKFFAFTSKHMRRSNRGRKYLFIYFNRLLTHHLFKADCILILQNIKKNQFEIIDFVKKLNLIANVDRLFIKYLRFEKTKYKNYKSIKKRTRKRLLLKNSL